MEEMLDVVDSDGTPTGEVVERSYAHAHGIMHRTSHVWLLRRHRGVVEVLLQLRSAHKESCPACYDISSAGHIPSGCSFEESAVRELHEELGIEAAQSELIYCGVRRFYYDREFWGKRYIDNQVSRVYALWRDIDADDIVYQREELDGVRWIAFDECERRVADNSMRHCIVDEELEILRKALYL